MNGIGIGILMKHQQTYLPEYDSGIGILDDRCKSIGFRVVVVVKGGFFKSGVAQILTS